MANNQEVIDVEEYHRNLQRKSDSLKIKYQKVREENKALETKLYKITHFSDSLHRQVFELDQKQRRVAQLLGFDDFDSVEENITANDPWVSGGKSRILFLEQELSDHKECDKEAQAARADMEELLADAQDEAQRLRQGRDFARCEAERRAADALVYRDELQACRDELRRCQDEVQFWRNEVTTKLPEMQAMIREQQTKNTAQLGHSSNAKKDDQRGEHDHLPLRDVANTLSLPKTNSPPPVGADSDHQYYKNQYELLQGKYTELLASKRKVSRRYFEDLKTWKEFRAWIENDDPGSGHAKCRVLRRRKKMESGLQDKPRVSYLEDLTALVPPEKSGPAKDPGAAPFDPNKEQLKLTENDKRRILPVVQETDPHLLSTLTPRVGPPSLIPLEEGLKQLSGLPAISNEHPCCTPIPLPSLTGKLSEQLPFSQQSMTQPSSMPPSPTGERMGTPLLQESMTQSYSMPMSPASERVGTSPTVIHSARARLQPRKNVIDRSPAGILVCAKQESEEQPLLLDPNESPLKKRGSLGSCVADESGGMPIPGTNPRNSIVKFQRNVGLAGDEALDDLPPDRQRPCTEIPVTVPLTALHSPKSKDVGTHLEGSEKRPASTVLATDTPPRANALVRHHSSPPDSPHVHRVNSSPDVIRGRKRKLRKLLDSEDADEDSDQNNSDPFVTGPSGLRGNPDISQTREQRAAHLKALGKQSHKEYMAEYMQYKGRGRYSNAKAASTENINAEFEIDPARNGGVDYQFDAVVRDKAGRKNLEAIDCECCRDYYEVIGPLPSRLQPPKWKSPARSQEQPSRQCRHQGKGARNELRLPSPTGTQMRAIEMHKHEISRHRHNWAPPITPPRYWHIGFPNTQEVEDINRQADDMHARKLQRIEAEANAKNGRYRRRV